MTHPHWALRAAELNSWVSDGCLDELVEASPEERARMAEWVAEDPAVQQLATIACTATARWAIFVSCPCDVLGKCRHQTARAV